MSLNWREIELILSEFNLEGYMIQKVVQNTFHSITWMLYSPNSGSVALYTEVGTPMSRIHLTGVQAAKSKTAKLQRFVQFARANIEGGRIVSVIQKPGDRQVDITITRQGHLMHIFIRLFSGPGSNIIVTDENMKILDLLFRRPNRNEVSSEILVEEEPSTSPKEFKVRPREAELTFNRQIDKEYSSKALEGSLQDIRAKVILQRDHKVAHELGTIAGLKKKIKENSDFDELRHVGDLLSANISFIKPHQTTIEVDDYLTGSKRMIVLSPTLKGSEHIQSYYEKAKRSKGTFDNARQELEETESRLRRIEEFYAKALESSGDETEDLIKLRSALKSVQGPADRPKAQAGIVCQSGSFPIIIGRTAKENDELLRHGFKGSDWWFHTRDCPGAYVFVRCPKTKTVPLEVMLDAANLAALYSKQKNDSKVNLYYTQVKYLKRVKNGPLGLVIPSQEKNLTISPDRKKAEKILGCKEFSFD